MNGQANNNANVLTHAKASKFMRIQMRFSTSHILPTSPPSFHFFTILTTKNNMHRLALAGARFLFAALTELCELRQHSAHRQFRILGAI
jgi:hypothetical protein